MQCIGHFRLLFGLLSVDSCKPIQHGALNVISSVTQNQECVNDIAASDVLVHLLLTLCSLPDAQITTLDTLYALMHTTKIVKDALAKGEHDVFNPFSSAAEGCCEVSKYAHTCSDMICTCVHTSVLCLGEKIEILCHSGYVASCSLSGVGSLRI
jgi:hypothetical protein